MKKVCFACKYWEPVDAEGNHGTCRAISTDRFRYEAEILIGECRDRSCRPVFLETSWNFGCRLWELGEIEDDE